MGKRTQVTVVSVVVVASLAMAVLLTYRERVTNGYFYLLRYEPALLADLETRLGITPPRPAQQPSTDTAAAPTGALTTAQFHTREAERLLNAGELGQADARLKEAEALEPDDAEVKALRARVNGALVAVERGPASQSGSVVASLPKREGIAASGNVVSGKASALDTATLRVNDVIVKLHGLKVGLTGDHLHMLQLFLNEQGDNVRCERQSDSAYVCKTASGVDVAAAAILNGAVEAGSGAPTQYRQFESEARAKRAGKWK